MLYGNTPQEMKAVERWHVWGHNADGAKVPLQVNGQYAKSNDPTTWTSFDTATAVAAKFEGVAFELGDGFVGVDLDDCIDSDGNVAQWARKIVEPFRDIAFCEISPSGEGLKLTMRGSKPAGATCQKKIDDGQLEVYDRTRFWAITGNVFENMTSFGDGTKLIAQLCAKHLTPTKPKPLRIIEASTASTGGSLLERAKQYVETSEPAGQGERNNRAFRIAGNLLSLQGSSGQTLTADEVFDYVTLWNWKNSEPLPENEIRAVIASAASNGTARAVKAHTTIERPDYGVSFPFLDNSDDSESVDEFDWSRVISGDDPGQETIDLNQPITLEELEALAANETPKAATDNSKPIKLPESVYNVPGFIGEYHAHLMESSPDQLPEAFLAAAICVLSTVIGGRIRFPIDGHTTRANINFVSTAPSGFGKNFARYKNQQILNDAAESRGNVKRFNGPTKFTGESAMLTAIQDFGDQIWQIDEFSKFLGGASANASAQQHGMLEIIMEVFTESHNERYEAKQYADSAKNVTLCRPYVAIYGTSTGEKFWQAIDGGIATDGFLSRHLITEDRPERVSVGEYQEVPIDEDGCAIEPEDLHTGFDEYLLAPLQYWGARQMQANTDDADIRFRAKPDARKRLVEYKAIVKSKRPDDSTIAGAIWGRASEKASKLAMLAAASRCSDIIELGDAEWAIRLTNSLVRRLIRRVVGRVAESDYERSMIKVLDVIDAEGGACDCRKVGRKTRGIDKRVRDRLIDDLVESGELVKLRVAGSTNAKAWIGRSYQSILNASN